VVVVEKLIGRYLADRKAGYGTCEFVVKTDLSRNGAESALKEALGRTTGRAPRVTPACDELLVFGWIDSDGVRLVPSRQGHIRNSWRRQFVGRLVDHGSGTELRAVFEPRSKLTFFVMAAVLGFGALYLLVNGTAGLGGLLNGHHSHHAAHELLNAASGAAVLVAALAVEFVAQRSAMKSERDLKTCLRAILSASSAEPGALSRL
jgi:hypothetical protein